MINKVHHGLIDVKHQVRSISIIVNSLNTIFLVFVRIIKPRDLVNNERHIQQETVLLSIKTIKKKKNNEQQISNHLTSNIRCVRYQRK
jgi:hypothetical protein